MNFSILHSIKFFLLILLLICVTSYAKDKDNKKLNKTLGSPTVTRMNINNVSTYIYNNGNSDIDPNQNSGLFFPKGSGKTAMFESGLIWGAKYNGEVRVGGSAYRQGLQPGRITESGQAEDPNAPNVRIYRVRPDYKTGNVQTEVSEEGTSEDAVRSQYEKDWNEWPAADGAPFDDVDSNGVYNPTIDIPGVPGASQTIWYVANDFDAANTIFMYGSTPLGLEMQATFWAYSQAGALGNMFFRRYTLINKSEQPFTDMYVSMWADPDLGDASDDFAGCDTTLSLGYVYNASARDAVYGDTPPPASGFDFFQGPVITGVAGQDRNKNGIDDAQDSAIFKGRKIGPGKINLPMTAFYYFARGDATVTDPTQGSYEGTTQFYNFMQGRIGKTGQLFTTPNNVQTTYALSGDPVAGTGWLDGQILAAGDRRIGSSSGPFTMAVGDTQEVVVAEICAGGSDRLQSITLLKSYDQKAQDAYNSFFQVPTGATPPKVTATPLNQEVILSWGNQADAAKTESYDSKGFRFQGYNVYQLRSASGSLDNATRIATFDLVDTIGTIYGYVFDSRTGKPELSPIQFGVNSGLKRTITITKDFINGGLPLRNGTRYYYAVTSYSFNPDPTAIPNVLENPISVITVVPQTNTPGSRYGSVPGDTLKAVHASGTSDGIITPVVVDPASTTGHTYLVRFKNPNDNSSNGVPTMWELVDQSTNQVVYTGENFTGSGSGSTKDTSSYYPIVDGVYLVVAGPPEAVKEYTVDNNDNRWVSGNAAGLESFFGGLGVGKNFFGSDLPASGYVPVQLKWVGGANASPPSAANGWSQGAIYRRDKGYAYDGIGWLPFTAWDVSDPANPKQINASFVEDSANGSANKQWDMGWDGTAFKDAGGREYIFINKTPYDPNHYNATVDGTSTDVLYALWPSARGTHTYLEAPWTMNIIPNYIILNSDTYTFSVPANIRDAALAKQDINKINVFPNPYYGVNPEEINKYERFVTFSHLPREAKIRIYNLAGTLVKTIDKVSESQFERWNLANENGLPVASGLFIVHIDMPGLGTKILKVAIIQEQQVLDRF